MCLASLVKNVFFWRFIMLLSKEYRLSNIMTQSLEERQGDTPLDCFCCSCVFGKLWNSTLPSLFSVLDVFFFYIVYRIVPSSLSTLFFFTPPCWFLLYLAIYQPPYLIPLSTLLLLSALTKCCGASAVGRFPAGYITTPSDSLNHCWARLARAGYVVLLLYRQVLLNGRDTVDVGWGSSPDPAMTALLSLLVQHSQSSDNKARTPKLYLSMWWMNSTTSENHWGNFSSVYNL